MNRFIAAHQNRGTLSAAQERALTTFVVNLGRARFNEYRQRVNVYGSIRSLSKGQAWKLIREITTDLEAAQGVQRV